MSETIKQGAEHIDRPVPDGITNVSVFAPPNGTMGPWAFCEVSGVDWSTDRDGNWDFEWGYDEHRTRIGLEREQVEFLAYLTGLVVPLPTSCGQVAPGPPTHERCADEHG